MKRIRLDPKDIWALSAGAFMGCTLPSLSMFVMAVLTYDWTISWLLLEVPLSPGMTVYSFVDRLFTDILYGMDAAHGRYTVVICSHDFDIRFDIPCSSKNYPVCDEPDYQTRISPTYGNFPIGKNP